MLNSCDVKLLQQKGKSRKRGAEDVGNQTMSFQFLLATHELADLINAMVFWGTIFMQKG